MFHLFDERYTENFKFRAREECRKSVRYVLRKNIIWGDALSLKTVAEPIGPIVLAQWSPVNGSLFKRKDFVFEELLRGGDASLLQPRQPSLFGEEQPTLGEMLHSETGEEVILPRPVKQFPPAHYMELWYAYEGWTGQVENPSLSYTGIARHDPKEIGLWDTTLQAEEAKMILEEIPAYDRAISK